MSKVSGWQDFWFKQVPARRFLFFRTALAMITLLSYLPRINGMIQDYISSSFHVPMLSGIPGLSPLFGKTLILTQFLACLSLLFGIWPQLFAIFLTWAGLYVFLLDNFHYAHWFLFHLILLAIVGCADQPAAVRLFKKSDLNSCPAWAEHLIRFQISIVLFYSALDKVFSPFWGRTGTFFVYEISPALNNALAIHSHSPFSQFRIALFKASIPHSGALSIATIGIEFFLAAGLLFRPFWKIVVPFGFLFAVALEFFISPRSFAWDLMAVFILFYPQNDPVRTNTRIHI